MLIYEKYVEETVDGNTVLVRHLYGTDANIPAIDDDQLTYKDNDGDVITPTLTDTYVDGGSANNIQKIKIISEDSLNGKALNVFIGDECVVGELEEKTITAIEITTNPTKTAYYVGDALDLTGMVVEATYVDGDKATITDYTSSPANGSTLSEAGDVTVTISAGGKSDTIDVTVTAVVLTSIEVATEPTKTTYNINETLDLTGMVVKAVYTNGDKETLASTDYATSPADGDTLDTTGEVTVTVTYEEKTTSFKVTVE